MATKTRKPKDAMEPFFRRGCMTVKELISELESFPDDAAVVFAERPKVSREKLNCITMVDPFDSSMERFKNTKKGMTLEFVRNVLEDEADDDVDFVVLR